MSDNKWLRLLAYVTGLVNQELLVQNEYLAAENRILKARLPRLASAMARGKLWRRSESGSAARRWKKLPASRNPIPLSFAKNVSD